MFRETLSRRDFQRTRWSRCGLEGEAFAKMSSSFVASDYGEPLTEDVLVGVYKDFVDCNAEFIRMGQDCSRKTFLVTQVRNKEG